MNWIQFFRIRLSFCVIYLDFYDWKFQECSSDGREFPLKMNIDWIRCTSDSVYFEIRAFEACIRIRFNLNLHPWSKIRICPRNVIRTNAIMDFIETLIMCGNEVWFWLILKLPRIRSVDSTVGQIQLIDDSELIDCVDRN